MHSYFVVESLRLIGTESRQLHLKTQYCCSSRSLSDGGLAHYAAYCTWVEIQESEAISVSRL